MIQALPSQQWPPSPSRRAPQQWPASRSRGAPQQSSPSPSRGGLGGGWVECPRLQPEIFSPQHPLRLTDNISCNTPNRQTSLQDLAMKAQAAKDVLNSKLQRTLRCNATDAERKLWQGLRGRQLAGCKFRRQHPFKRFIVDFVCLERKLVVEIDGSQHLNAIERDEARDRLLAGAGFRTLRFWNNDVLVNTATVLQTILTVLGDTHPLPSPPLEGEGAESLPPPSREH
jgi:very-short-patch-repair endonuclease